MGRKDGRAERDGWRVVGAAEPGTAEQRERLSAGVERGEGGQAELLDGV